MAKDIKEMNPCVFIFYSEKGGMTDFKNVRKECIKIG